MFKNYINNEITIFYKILIKVNQWSLEPIWKFFEKQWFQTLRQAVFFSVFFYFGSLCTHWQNLFSTKRVLVKKRKHFSLEVYISGGNASCSRGHPKGENLRIVCLYTFSDRKKIIHISQISEKLCIYYKIFFFYFGTIFTKLHISVIH